MKFSKIIFILFFFVFILSVLSNSSFSYCIIDLDISYEREFFFDGVQDVVLETNEHPINYSNQISNPSFEKEMRNIKIEDNFYSDEFKVTRYNSINNLKGNISNYPFDFNTRRELEKNYSEYLNYSTSIKSLIDEINITNNSLKNVYKFSEYVHNYIEYDREITQVQSIDEIIERKTGVCFHYSKLLVNILRYYGYPAREMNGFAYSNIYDEFEGHSWVEVYVPDLGWIEIDPTFGEHFFVNPKRVFISYGDIKSRFEWRGRGDFDKNTERFFDITYKKDNCFSNVSWDFEIYPNEVKPGSQTLLTLELSNNHPYHIFHYISFSSPSKLDFKFSEPILVKSNSNLTKNILIDVPDSFDENYVYTLPIVASDRFGNMYESSFDVGSNFNDYQISKDEKMDSAFFISLECIEDYFYVFENNSINCYLSHDSLKNKYFNLSVKYSNESILNESISVDVNSDELISIQLPNKSIGSHDLNFLISSNSIENDFEKEYVIKKGNASFDCNYDYQSNYFNCDVNSSFNGNLVVNHNNELISRNHINGSDSIKIERDLEITDFQEISKNSFNVQLDLRTSKGSYKVSKEFIYHYEYSLFEYLVFKIKNFFYNLF